MARRRRSVAVWAVVAALLGACSSHPRSTASTRTTTAAAAAAAACRTPHSPGLSPQTFEFRGVSRTYELYVPKLYQGVAVPVVFEFHGFGGSGAQAIAYGDFRPLAERDTFLIVAPDGQGSPRNFNITGDPGRQDDVAMVRALLNRIEATFCVDKTRVFASGMSNGGAMSTLLACKASDRFAAFGPVAAMTYAPGCAGQRNVSMVSFMGTADPVVPFNGGKVNCCGGLSIAAAPDTMQHWAEHDQCVQPFAEERLDSEVRRRMWVGCGGTSSVVFYIIDGGGHTWPGSTPIPQLGLTTNQIDASETIWNFFKLHPLGS